MQKFNVGDKVKITGEGSQINWANAMYDTIGMIGIVLKYDCQFDDYKIAVCAGDFWWYKPDNLELVEPAVQAIPSAQQQVVTNNTTSELLTIEQAIHLLKSNGYKVYKEM